MASSSSNTGKNHEKATEKITQEEFFAFHNVDRQFFIRLVFSLGRDHFQVIQASAFWIWLERLNMAQYVATIIRYPDPILEALFEETLLCLRVVEFEEMEIHPNIDLPMVQSIVGVHGQGINLKYFKDNRVQVLSGINSIIQQICLRAFQDLIQVIYSYKQDNVIIVDSSRVNEFSSLPLVPNVHYNPSAGVISNDCGGQILELRPTPTSQPQQMLSSIYEQSFEDKDTRILAYNPLLRVGDFNLSLKGQHHSPSSSNVLQGGGASSSHKAPMSIVNVGDSSFNMQRQPPILQGDLVDQLLTQMLKGEEQKVPPSERTIFLTFSKGYPIHEIELRDFLNRSFGDITEALYMQEVSTDEQPLYARLVVRDASAMVAVLSEHGKSKFTINGKHVWARKYVRKTNINSPPTSPSTN